MRVREISQLALALRSAFSRWTFLAFEALIRFLPHLASQTRAPPPERATRFPTVLTERDVCFLAPIIMTNMALLFAPVRVAS